jgi:hypoxanthine phosphoribosyltransferase
MKRIKVLDKEFKMSIPASNIRKAVEQLAIQINNDYYEEEILFICILNGCFMFAADLLKKIKVPCQISFVKLASYEGLSSTGSIQELIGINEKIAGKKIIILEDIIDTGTTVDTIVTKLRTMNPASLKVATFLFKPQSYHKNLKIDYIGMEIPEQFIIGYGLDYHGYGRNLEDIYSLIK